MDVRTTTRGTPWATTWDGAWAERVEAVESVLDRCVCGARTLSGEPCTLESDHLSGRCRYHGGTDAIGAPVGNQNARTHGLYARRLQRCGTHCPMWEHCPFAGDDVLALEAKERPVCAYESAEYEALLEELEGDDRDTRERVYDDSIRENPCDPSNPRTYSTQHNLALLQVMLSRAAAALSVTALTDTTTSESDRYQLHTTKMHPALQAFLRISRELRALHAEHRSTVQFAPCGSAGASPSPAPDREGRGSDCDSQGCDLAALDPGLIEVSNDILREAEGEREEYTRRLEWIVHDQLGADWREFETIREFALPRAERVPGEATHDVRFKTDHPPPNDRPARLKDDVQMATARGP